MGFKYWSGTTGYEFPDDPPYTEVGYTPSHIALVRDNYYVAFINGSNGYLYRMDIGVGEATPTVTAVDVSNTYIGLVGSTGDYAYALRSNGVVYQCTISSGALATQIGTATSPNKLLYVNGLFFVIDTGGHIWYDNAGSLSEWATYTWAGLGYDGTNSVYIGVGLDGKAYQFAAILDTPTQIGSDTDWVDVHYNGYAAKSSGIVYTGMGGTPTALTGTYDAITAFQNSYCSPQQSYFVSDTGKMYYDNAGAMTQYGTRNDVIYAVSKSPTIGSIAAAYLMALEEDISEGASSTDLQTTSAITTNVSTDLSVMTGSFANIELSVSSDDSAVVSESTVSDIVVWFYESITSTETSSNNIVGYGSYSDSVVVQETLTALFTQLISESASGSETWFLEISTLIADVVVASGIQTSNAVLSNAIAEAVVAIELQQSGLIETISDSATAAEVVTSLVTATQAIIEQVIAAELSTSYLFLINTISESSQATEDISIWQVLTQNIEEGATAFVHLNIGGESYTGWVMNTNNLAVSEYQGMNFNSLCKIGNRYFGASDIGVYELTGSTDSGTDIHTYIQSGLVDFGSTQQKRVSDSYIAADADGRIALGVAVSEKEGISRYWYEITPSMAAINNIKLPIGRGLRGKYWKFDVASESMSEFDAITVLPYVLKRRI